MTNIDDDVLDRLEAEAKVADAEAEELTLAVESDIEQKDEEIEELQSEVDEKESEVEELESEIEDKEERIEEMSEKIDIMAEQYAEELAQHSEVMDSDDFLDKFEFEELQEKADELETDTQSSPAPNSGDPGAGFQSPGNDDNENDETEELSNKAKVAAEQFKRRGGVWKEVAEDLEENGLGEVRRGDKSEEAVFE